MITLTCTCCRKGYGTTRTTVNGQWVGQWWRNERSETCRACAGHAAPCGQGDQRPGLTHRGGSDTEREAAESVTSITGALRMQVLALLEQHPDGLTDDEGGALMGGDRLKFGRRRQELCDAGLVIDSGLRRLTPSRRKAAVWVRTTTSRGQQ